MKPILLTILFIFVPKLCISQISENNQKIYLDSLWKETTEGNHKYYRIIAPYDSQKKLYNIKDYNKFGVLLIDGNSKTTDAFVKEGEFVYYYDNGNKKCAENYNNNKSIGKSEQWYENGNKKSEGEYFESQKRINNDYKLYQYWNPEGKQTIIDGNGYYEEIGEDYADSGNIKNGLKEGTWKGEYSKKHKYVEEYKNNVLESRPEPKGGIGDFYQYIGKNFTVPKEYENLKGKIITTFIVDKDGTIIEPKIIKSVNETLDQEAIRVLTSFEKWIPAKQRGQYVRVLYSIPITLAGMK